MRVILIFLLIGLFACNPKKDKPSEFAQGTSGEIFGSGYAIKYYSEKNLDKEIQKVLYDFNKVANTYDSISLLSQFNKGKILEIKDPILIDITNISKMYEQKTDGYFDPTVTPLMNLWGFSSEKIKHLPTSAEVDSVMQFVGMDKLIISKQKITKTNPKTQLSFNSITGYVNDQMAKMLESHGVTNYLINIGSELTAHGAKPGGETWAVGVDKPIEYSTDQKVQIAFPLKNLSLATSGNYRKFYIDQDTGEKIVHTMNPKTGYPAKSKLLSASVIAESCAEADATATALMAMGYEKAVDFVENKSKLPAYFIWSEKDSVIAKGWNNFPQ